MTARPVRLDVTVWSPKGIAPLEIWDTEVDGRTLFDRRADRDFYDVLARAIPKDPHAVVLAGGGVDRARAEQAFASVDRPLALVDDDPFFAAAGAFAELGATTLDAGQTSVKAVSALGRVRVARAGESSLAELLASALDHVGRVGGPNARTAQGEVVLVALPCEVTIEGGTIVLGACSYAIEGEARRLSDALVQSARTPIRAIRLVNDAVLAAHVARRLLPPGERALVLTIGHGVGAAVVEGAS